MGIQLKEELQKELCRILCIIYLLSAKCTSICCSYVGRAGSSDQWRVEQVRSCRVWCPSAGAGCARVWGGTITIIYPSANISRPTLSKAAPLPGPPRPMHPCPRSRAGLGPAPKKRIMVFRMIHLAPESWTVHSFFYHHWITARCAVPGLCRAAL